MFELLQKRGFKIAFHSHSKAILDADFPDVVRELEDILAHAAIPIEEIIASGGGETKGTQRLRRALKENGWRKHKFVVRRTIDDEERESQSHEVDHFRRFDAGTVALEIEWNNKDPFFDRDLENFKRLHADGAISLGIIVTRGADLQRSMKSFVARFAEAHRINSFEDVRRLGGDPTRRQVREVTKRVERAKNPMTFRDAWVSQFVSDKYGAATTHWDKLEDRVQRGVGNPCPLLLIGLPSSIVSFNESYAEVESLINEGASELAEGAGELQ
jgi:hypothetical protein